MKLPNSAFMRNMQGYGGYPIKNQFLSISLSKIVMNLLLTIIYLSYYSAHAFSVNQRTASPSKTTTVAPTSSNTINAKKHNIPRFKYQQGVFVNFDLKNSEKSTPKSPEELAKIASDYAIKQLNLKDENDFNVHQKTYI